jgi:hypothetical protein
MTKKSIVATSGDMIPTQGKSPEPAHQSWPAATPQVLIPSVPMMQKQTYAAAMSYIGSSRRIGAWVKRAGAGSPVAAMFAWSAAVLAIPLMWMVVTVWYFFTLVIFGWLMIPFRLIRRSHRKQEHIQRTQLATMQAIMIQQQQALAQNQSQAR